MPFTSTFRPADSPDVADDQLISGVEIRCEEKGRVRALPVTSAAQARSSWAPPSVLLRLNRVVPLYTLIQDNYNKEGWALGMAVGTSRYQPSHPCPLWLRPSGWSSSAWWGPAFTDCLLSGEHVCNLVTLAAVTDKFSNPSDLVWLRLFYLHRVLNSWFDYG